MADLRSSEGRSGGLALVMTTLPDTASAERFVRELLEERAIACGNVVTEVASLYWWEGRIARESEVMVFLKTPLDGVNRLIQRAGEIHPYDVPELVELPVGRSSEAYNRWVTESTRIGA